ESFHHQPDAADARIHRKGFRRQHDRRNGHRPDGQLSVHGHKGVREPEPQGGLAKRNPPVSANEEAGYAFGYMLTLPERSQGSSRLPASGVPTALRVRR